MSDQYRFPQYVLSIINQKDLSWNTFTKGLYKYCAILLVEEKDQPFYFRDRQPICGLKFHGIYRFNLNMAPRQRKQ